VAVWILGLVAFLAKCGSPALGLGGLRLDSWPFLFYFIFHFRRRGCDGRDGRRLGVEMARDGGCACFFGFVRTYILCRGLQNATQTHRNAVLALLGRHSAASFLVSI